MKFYNREKELALLEKTRQIAFTQHSQLTVLTGRRRIGKTKLILKSCEESPTVYLFVSRSNEAMLCRGFAQHINSVLSNIFIPESINSFADVFEMLMNQIYMDAREPLYGRCDSIIKLRPFSTSVLKDILHDHKPDYTNEDLLALYTFTGGVPKYIDLFMQKGCTDMESMVDYIVQSDSPFLNEGKALLIQEFGKKYGNYFAILADIANGRNTTAEIEQNMGDMVIAGHLKKLEEDYELIVRKRPILAKEGSQTVRFEISDLFLRFWFRYFIKYHRLVEMENFEQLGQLIKNDYPTYSGSTLEQYLRQQMMESCNFMDIGSWWQAKKGKEACEIDIVGLYVEDRKALVAEVKRQRKNFKPDDFAIKVETLRNKVLHKYDIQTECLTLEDM
ncbi:MAG: ATPase [Phocaeicola vulgatus]|uniref:ATPase n=2 Tax=Phocaeicola vulgatus TaxID=821 RepID=A0A1Q6IWT0_PHOVU|nr:MAG: ATPase [Phocaeicola vulgatus]